MASNAPPQVSPLSEHQQQELDTSLLFAVGGGEAEKARALVRRGANPSASKNLPGISPPNNKTTALIEAARLGHDKMLRILLSARALDVSATDSFGDSALAWASAAGHLESVKLLAPVSNVQSKNSSGQTALMLAARNGFTAGVKELLADSNVLDVDDRGRSALMIACSHGQLQTVAALIEASDIDAEDQYGCTALCHAISGREEAICDLLAPRSDLGKKLTLGGTALDFARSRRIDSATRRIFEIIFSFAERQTLSAVSTTETRKNRASHARSL